jgi:hypothetical protein
MYSVDEVVLHEAAYIVKGYEGGVGGYWYDVGAVLEGSEADKVADATNIVYSNSDSHD